MATALSRTIANLETAAEQASAVLAQLDADAAADPAAALSMTYTSGSVQMGFNEFRASLLQQIKDYGATIEGLKKGAQLAAGPFTIRHGTVRG